MNLAPVLGSVKVGRVPEKPLASDALGEIGKLLVASPLALLVVFSVRLFYNSL